MSGTLYGVGVGPGDPELVTVKAARLITAAEIVAYHGARPGSSLARAAAVPYLRPGQTEVELLYPMTRGETDYPGGYSALLEEFYTSAAQRLADHLAAGRDVVLLAEGDPTLFSSFMHMHRRLRDRFTCVIVPGVTSVAAAAAAAGTPLVEAGEALTVLSGMMPPHELTARLRGSEAAVVLKLSRDVAGIRDAVEAAGRLDDAVYVRRASHPDQLVAPFRDVDPDAVPYMSAVVIPGPIAASRETPPRLKAAGEVVVIGLGPAGPQWLTPEAREELAAAEHVVGYETYVARVPFAAGQQRHASDNRVEAERAEFALSLARGGARVAVVSSGDPGVFAMASAVLEVRETAGYDDVPVRVVPGLTAAQAVASRVGAPLGHDFCVLSLSDQLKPWEIVAKRLDAAGAADLVVALYNPGSRTRRTAIVDARDVLLRHRKPDTPVIVGRAVGSPEEKVTIVALGDLTADDADMRTLLIVGSSQTRISYDADGTPRAFTPRTYS